jgi:hypothetical protein
LTLGNNITLQGRDDNTRQIVQVTEGGVLEMSTGSKISGNTCPYNGSGVNLDSGTFTMTGGEISGNTATEFDGGGVSVYEGTFTMTGGEISGNTTTTDNPGGGVSVKKQGTFTMTGGTISGNTANTSGGGVQVYATAAFTMKGGTISGNTAKGGGGVCAYQGTFTMEDGAISGNTAKWGGGVDVAENAAFTKKGGTIYGDTDTDHTPGSTKNTAASGDGHAVLKEWDRERTADAGPEIKLYAKYENGAWTYNDTSAGGVGDTAANWK